jgi:hypothetical protein
MKLERILKLIVKQYNSIVIQFSSQLSQISIIDYLLIGWYILGFYFIVMCTDINRYLYISGVIIFTISLMIVLRKISNLLFNLTAILIIYFGIKLLSILY